MQWFKTGKQLGQAVKNMQRLRNILAVLAKYGFVDIVQKINLGKLLPSQLAKFAATQAEKSNAERLRLAFEELGPTFVKLGQLLSTRPDLLPESFIEEFTHLQDNVQPLPFTIVRGIIERELGKTLESAYSFVDPTPLAAASIGQVHPAQLLTGESVVIKVQRPEIEKIINTDISLLAFLAGLIEKYIPESRIIGPCTIVDEFFRTLSFELDFVVEANNMIKISENTVHIPEIVIPKVYRSLSTHKILTLEKLEGIRVNDIKALETAGIDKKKIVELGARTFFHSIMIDGLFHGDLHGGNIFVLPGNRLGIIDFGIVGRLSQKARDQLANMVMSLLTEDYENLCYEYAELGTASVSINFDAFQRDVRNTLSPYMGLPLSDINLGKVLIEATKTANRYDIKVPGDWMLVFKAILTIEGMGRSLDPDFDLLSLGHELVKDLVKNQYSMQRLSKESMWIAKDVAALLKVLPRQIRWMLRKFNSNDFALEVKSPDLIKLKNQLNVSIEKLSLSIIISGLFLSGSIALQYANTRTIGDYPILSVLLFSLGILFMLRFWFKKK